MLFNSLQFFLFFIIVTSGFFLLPHRFRWVLLLSSSCYFYMAFVPKYIIILGGTIIVDYFIGLHLEKIKNPGRKRTFLILSLIANIGVLGVFKYYNFFQKNVVDFLEIFNVHAPIPILEILLPIGLSFHTFQAMSYTIEVYRGNQKAEKHFGIYALYVMFYPQLVAGPIERPQNILHQFHEKKYFDFEKMKSGLIQMAFGLFKKIVIADRLAILVDQAFASPESQNGSGMFIACVFYSFQIYCDFSGYSDIGIGAARTMGYDLMTNFKAPYLSRSISEFWSRWHISLSTWFRDYVYIPLGGNRTGKSRWFMNLMIVFLISGLWHGASWTFIIWGFIHGCYLIIGILKNSILKINSTSWFWNLVNITTTFLLVTLAWIFFRAPSFTVAMVALKKIFSASLFDAPNFEVNANYILFSIAMIIFLLWKEKNFLTIPTNKTSTFIILFLITLSFCYVFGVMNNKQFIYFQF